MDTESKTYDEAEFQRLYDQLLGYLGKDQELAEQIKKLRMARGLTQNECPRARYPGGRAKEAVRLRAWNGCAGR